MFLAGDNSLSELLSRWFEAKAFLIALAGGERLALVVIGAVVLQCLVAMCLRRRLSSAIPWAMVLIGLCANEILTIASDRYVDDDELIASLQDLILAMTLPSLLLAVSRFYPSLFRAPIEIRPIRALDQYMLPRATAIEDVEFEEVS